MTIADFCKKYQCNEQEFEERLRQLYRYNGGGIQAIFWELRSNEKKRKKKKDEVPKSESTNGASVKETCAKRLESLKNAKETQQRKIAQINTEYSELLSEQLGNIKALRKLKRDIEKLLGKFRVMNAEAMDLIVHITEIASRIEQNVAKRRKEEAVLEEISEKIQELAKITLYVYDSGEIVLDDGTPIPEPGEVAIKAMREKLESSNKEEYENLRITEAKLLTKLLIFASSQTAEVEVLCDSEGLKKAFDAFY
ncbi:hypothetical protein J6S37_01610 [Candidatus Saccharibacteria bacterium]|nr:hypothetical protein [Candidatus Saccharibacteria bacterium]